jgi:thiamine-phosphate pyrophosphorylase
MTESACSWGLYLISCETMLRKSSFLPFLEKALRAGVRAVQLRAKNALDEDELLRIGREARRLTREAGAAFIVNDRVDLAMQLDADGAHVGQDDLSPAEARRILGAGKLLGLSTHSREQVLRAQREPVDYIGFGPVFPTMTKESPSPVTGLPNLAWAVRNSRLPVVAIGGITLENVDDVLAAGARNAAVISAVSQAPDPVEAVRAFLSRFQRDT